MSYAINQATWLRNILKDLNHKNLGATQIFCNNKSKIAMASFVKWKRLKTLN